jgi:hypothetical protein
MGEFGSLTTQRALWYFVDGEMFGLFSDLSIPVQLII